MAKLKTRLLNNGNPITKAEDAPGELQSWLAQHNLKPNRSGFVDPRKVPLYSLNGAPNRFSIPLHPMVKVYQTLDQKHYYTEGQNPKAVKQRTVVYPVRSVQLEGDKVRICRKHIVRGAEVADLLSETLYDGPITNLPPRLRRLLDLHIQLIRTEMAAKAEKK